MTEFDNTNRGSVWGNEDKTAETPTWADFKGSVNIEGVEYWVSMWKRKPDANPKAPPLSFTVKKKEQQTTQPPKDYAEPKGDTGGGGFDDIPFAPVDWRTV